MRIVPIGTGGEPAPVKSVTASSSDNTVLSVSVNGDSIKITPYKLGSATIDIEAENELGDVKTLQITVEVKKVFDYLSMTNRRGYDEHDGSPYAYYEDVVTVENNSSLVHFDSLHGTGHIYDVNIVKNEGESYTLTAVPDENTNSFFTARLTVDGKVYGTDSMGFRLNPSGGYNLQSADFVCNVLGAKYEPGTVNINTDDEAHIEVTTIPDVFNRASDVVITVTSDNESVVLPTGETEGFGERRDFGLSILSPGTANVTVNLISTNDEFTASFQINVA